MRAAHAWSPCRSSDRRRSGMIAFYALAPAVALGLAVGRRGSAVVCQSPYEGFGVLVLRKLVPSRLRPRVQIELHGDWRTAARLYGSSKRRLLGPLSDHIAVWALRRADRVRPVSQRLADLAREYGYEGPLDRFITFSDFSAFLDGAPTEPPVEPRVLFAGVLERYKAVDVLIDAWADVARRIPRRA